MAEKRTRRPNKTKEEVIAELESKIAYHEKCIANLKVKIEEVKNPTANPKKQIKAIFAKAEEQGLSPEEIAAKLGITL